MQGRVEFQARPAGTAHYIDGSGTAWRIYDCVRRGASLERVYLESIHATHRVFVASSGQQEVYRRWPQESFAISAENCARQLAAALARSKRTSPVERRERLLV